MNNSNKPGSLDLTTYWGMVYPWHCDHMGHMNVMWYVGKFRDELLNREIFYSLREAQVIIEQWRTAYNTVRPHSALGYQPPAPEAVLVPVLAQPLCTVETSITT